MVELGRRAVACKGWRWMPGMLVCTPRTIPSRFTEDEDWAPDCDDWPDLSDPCTLGGLLALVREAWGRPGLTTKLHPVLGWILIDGHDDPIKSVAKDTEAEALVSALEAAP
jgi:hypothetical protein